MFGYDDENQLANVMVANAWKSEFLYDGMNVMSRTLILLLAIFTVQSTWGFYDPSAGQWLNRDPVEEGGGINLYQFVHNSPLNNVDPHGLQISLSQPGGAAIVLEAEAAAAGFPSYAAMVAAEQAAARAAAAAAALATTSFCNRPNDPCKGLRDQLNEHIKKLVDYIKNPDAFDNKEFLKKNPGRRDQIIDGRIKSLQKQIENFKKQLEACEKAKGLK